MSFIYLQTPYLCFLAPTRALSSVVSTLHNSTWLSPQSCQCSPLTAVPVTRHKDDSFHIPQFSLKVHQITLICFPTDFELPILSSVVCSLIITNWAWLRKCMKHTVNIEQAIILVLKLSFDGNPQANRQKHYPGTAFKFEAHFFQHLTSSRGESVAQ